MARWTGQPEAEAVLKAADAWKERCFVNDGALFTDSLLWTQPNFTELKRRFISNPIVGSDRTFLQKLKEQLSASEPEVIQLA